LIVDLARRHCEDSRVQVGEHLVDLSGPFARRTYHELVAEHAGVDPRDEAAVREKARALGVPADDLPPGKVLDEVFEECVVPRLIQPTFVTLYPRDISPLSKCSADDAELAERFELFIHTWEVANAFSELNDPVEQRRRFEVQVASRDPESPAVVDEDYLRALEQGMPPAGGLGIGIDRLMMILTGNLSIRETILFPLLRPAAADPEAGEGGLAGTAP
jgi:lysyl-tRNA synthetase class 2